MLDKVIEINGCKHYLASQNCYKSVFFINTPSYTEIDFSIKHPLGYVLKSQRVVDSNIRYILQRNQSLLIFNKLEWLNEENPYLHTKGIFSSLFKKLKKTAYFKWLSKKV